MLVSGKKTQYSKQCLMSNYQAILQIRSLSNIICNGNMCMPSHVRLFATPWTVTHKAPLSMGFSRQEYQSGLPFPPSRDLPHPGIELMSLMSPALVGKFFTTEQPGKPWIELLRVANCGKTKVWRN